MGKYTCALHAPPAQASAPHTPPPRSKQVPPSPTSSAPASRGAQSRYETTPSPPSSSSTPAPVHYAARPQSVPPGQPAPMPASVPPPKGPARKAWKKSGPVIGKASGLLLLALAALTILGALFVVFSLME